MENEVLNIFFLFKNFFKERDILRENGGKIFLGHATIFSEQRGHLMPQMSVTFFINN